MQLCVLEAETQKGFGNRGQTLFRASQNCPVLELSELCSMGALSTIVIRLVL